MQRKWGTITHDDGRWSTVGAVEIGCLKSQGGGARMINGQSYIQAFRPGLVYKSGKGFSTLWRCEQPFDVKHQLKSPTKSLTYKLAFFAHGKTLIYAYFLVDLSGFILENNILYPLQILVHLDEFIHVYFRSGLIYTIYIHIFVTLITHFHAIY
jgi:hypothetical protein